MILSARVSRFPTSSTSFGTVDRRSHVGSSELHNVQATSSSSWSPPLRQSKAATVPIGPHQVSLPLLVVAGVSVLVAGLLWRAFMTFGASLVRLFVLIVLLAAGIVLSQLSEKHRPTPPHAPGTSAGIGHAPLQRSASAIAATDYQRTRPLPHIATSQPVTPLSSSMSAAAPLVSDARTRQLMMQHERFGSV